VFPAAVTSFLLCPDILISTLFLSIRNRWPSLGVRETTFHSHTEQQAKLTICKLACILIFAFSNGRREYRTFRIQWLRPFPNLKASNTYYTLASHRGGQGSIPGQVMWDLWWTKWHWGRFSPSTLVSPANPHSTDCSIIIIDHPGLVQQANSGRRTKWTQSHPTQRN
jgi:hypothetical protein